jgi:hypothetical protein
MSRLFVGMLGAWGTSHAHGKHGHGTDDFFAVFSQRGEFFPPVQLEGFGLFLGFGMGVILFSRELRGFWGRIIADWPYSAGFVMFCS